MIHIINLKTGEKMDYYTNQRIIPTDFNFPALVYGTLDKEDEYTAPLPPSLVVNGEENIQYIQSMDTQYYQPSYPTDNPQDYNSTNYVEILYDPDTDSLQVVLTYGNLNKATLFKRGDLNEESIKVISRSEKFCLFIEGQCQYLHIEHFITGNTISWKSGTPPSTGGISGIGGNEFINFVEDWSSYQIKKILNLTNRFNSNLDNISTEIIQLNTDIESKTNAIKIELNNKINKLQEDLNHIQSLIEGIDVEAIREELQGEITNINTALNSLEAEADRKIEEVEASVSSAVSRLDSEIEKANTQLQGTIDSFNESFSQEIASTTAILQSQLEDALHETEQLKVEVDNKIKEIRSQVDDLLEDAVTVFRSTVTSIATTR